MAPNTASRNDQNGSSKVAAAAATANRVAKHIRENVIGTPKVKKLIDSAMNLVFFCFASILFGIILIGSELATLCVCSGLNFMKQRTQSQATTNDSNNKAPSSAEKNNTGSQKSSGKKGKANKSKENNHQGHNQENHEQQQDANNHED